MAESLIIQALEAYYKNGIVSRGRLWTQLFSSLDPLNIIDDIVIFKNYNINYSIYGDYIRKKIKGIDVGLKTKRGLLYKLDRERKKK